MLCQIFCWPLLVLNCFASGHKQRTSACTIAHYKGKKKAECCIHSSLAVADWLQCRQAISKFPKDRAEHSHIKRSHAGAVRKAVVLHAAEHNQRVLCVMQVTAKLALAQQLEREHSRLQAEHQLLVACCDSLQLLRLQHGEAEHIHEEELALLKQLQVRVGWRIMGLMGESPAQCLQG